MTICSFPVISVQTQPYGLQRTYLSTDFLCDQQFIGNNKFPEELLNLSTPYQVSKYCLPNEYLEEGVNLPELYNGQNRPIVTSKEELHNSLAYCCISIL